MPINLGNPTWITLVADSGTPSNVMQYAGMRLPIPASVTLPANGVRDTIEVSGITVYGYLQDDGVGGRQWLMAPATNPVVEALNAIPGADGWADAGAKSTNASLGQTLLGRGLSLIEVQSGFTQLYNAAKANLLAKGWTPPA